MHLDLPLLPTHFLQTIASPGIPGLRCGNYRIASVALPGVQRPFFCVGSPISVSEVRALFAVRQSGSQSDFRRFGGRKTSLSVEKAAHTCLSLRAVPEKILHNSPPNASRNCERDVRRKLIVFLRIGLLSAP
jgi:hypothetical protein